MMSKIEMYRIFMLEHNVIIDPAYNKPYIFSDKKNEYTFMLELLKGFDFNIHVTNKNNPNKNFVVNPNKNIMKFTIILYKITNKNVKRNEVLEFFNFMQKCL